MDDELYVILLWDLNTLVTGLWRIKVEVLTGASFGPEFHHRVEFGRRLGC